MAGLKMDLGEGNPPVFQLLQQLLEGLNLPLDIGAVGGGGLSAVQRWVKIPSTRRCFMVKI